MGNQPFKTLSINWSTRSCISIETCNQWRLNLISSLGHSWFMKNTRKLAYIKFSQRNCLFLRWWSTLSKEYCWWLLFHQVWLKLVPLYQNHYFNDIFLSNMRKSWLNKNNEAMCSNHWPLGRASSNYTFW